MLLVTIVLCGDFHDLNVLIQIKIRIKRVVPIIGLGTYLTVGVKVRRSGC